MCSFSRDDNYLYLRCENIFYCNIEILVITLLLEIIAPITHTGLEAYPTNKNGPLMGQAFLDLSDPGGGGMGWQNLRKWEKS